MHGENVFLEIALPVGAVGAVGAGEGPLPRVDENVSLEVFVVGERLAAQVAHFDGTVAVGVQHCALVTPNFGTIQKVLKIHLRATKQLL